MALVVFHTRYQNGVRTRHYHDGFDVGSATAILTLLCTARKNTDAVREMDQVRADQNNEVRPFAVGLLRSRKCRLSSPICENIDSVGELSRMMFSDELHMLAGRGGVPQVPESPAISVSLENWSAGCPIVWEFWSGVIRSERCYQMLQLSDQLQ